MTPEFPRPWRLDQIGAGETKVSVSAEPEERAALAKRFGIPAIVRLEAEGMLRREAAGIRARGHLSAEVVQSCVVTDEDVPAAIEEDFELLFVPEPAEGGDEIELDVSQCDTVFYTGAAIDLGEAAAETLALALDPFPRSPAAAEALRKAGVLSEEEAAAPAEAPAGPFGGLAGLKDLLKE